MDGSGDSFFSKFFARIPTEVTLGNMALTVAFLAVMLGPLALALYALTSLAG